mgnify:CR=1 FL=1
MLLGWHVPHSLEHFLHARHEVINVMGCGLLLSSQRWQRYAGQGRPIEASLYHGYGKMAFADGSSYEGEGYAGAVYSGLEYGAGLAAMGAGEEYDAAGFHDALDDAVAAAGGVVVIALGKVLEAVALHAEGDALLSAFDGGIIPRVPAPRAVGEIGELVGVGGVGLAELKRRGRVPHVLHRRLLRHLLLSQLRYRRLLRLH